MAFDLTDKQKKTGVALAAIGLVGGLFLVNYPKKALEIGTGCLGLAIGAYWFINIRKPAEVKQAVAVAMSSETNTAVLRDFATRLSDAGYKDDAKAMLAKANQLDQIANSANSRPAAIAAAYAPAIQAAPVVSSPTLMVQRVYR